MWLSDDIKDYEYHKMPGVSWHQLKEFIKSPRHFKAQFERPKGSTPAMQYGSLLHLLTLQPHEYLRRLVEDSRADRRTKEGKVEYAAFLEGLQTDSIVVSHRDSLTSTREAVAVRSPEGMVFGVDEVSEAFEMRNECWRHPLWMETLASEIDIENNAIRFQDDVIVERGGTIELEGVEWRFKPDMRSAERRIIWDYKTCESADDGLFLRAMARLGYHYQLAFYSMMASAIDGVPYDTVIWVAQEKSYPYAVRYIKLPSDALYYARSQLLLVIDRFVQTWAFNDWSLAYPNEILTLDVPEWAFKLTGDF